MGVFSPNIIVFEAKIVQTRKKPVALEAGMPGRPQDISTFCSEAKRLLYNFNKFLSSDSNTLNPDAMCAYKIALFATQNIIIGPISGLLSTLLNIISVA